MLPTLLPRYGRLQERSLTWAVLAASSNPHFAPRGTDQPITFASVSQRRDVCSGTHKQREIQALSSVFATGQSWFKPCHFPIDCGKQQEEKGHGKFQVVQLRFQADACGRGDRLRVQWQTNRSLGGQFANCYKLRGSGLL